MWTRRCPEVEIILSTPERLEARVVCVEWAAPGAVQRLAAALPVAAALTDRLRRSLGDTQTTSITCDDAPDAPGQRLALDGEPVDVGLVESVALLGWQESAGASRLWDVTLLGGEEPLDLVVGHPEYETAAALAEELAQRLGVPLRESSCVGGSQDAPDSGASLSGPPRRCCV